MEGSISAGLFFLLLSVVYPNIILFQKSYSALTNYVEYRFQEGELRRLLHQLLFHSFPHSNLKENFFVLEKLNDKWFQKDLTELERQKVKKGKLVFFSCIFWREEEKLVRNIFFIYFEEGSLYLAEHIHGVFHTGNKISLLDNVDGSFEKEGDLLTMSYWKRGETEKKEVIYGAVKKK